MLEIAELKTKKLPELQEIAKNLGIKGIAGQKKLDLAYNIIDHIASQPEEKKKHSPNPNQKKHLKKKPLKKRKMVRQKLIKNIQIKMVKISSSTKITRANTIRK